MEADDRVKSIAEDEEAASKQDLLLKVPLIAMMEKSSRETNSIASASSNWNEQDHNEEQIERAKAEMSKVREENQRLKMCLDQIMKDYETLKRQFHEIVQKEEKKSTQTSASTIYDEVVEDRMDEMVSLTLGRFSSDHQRKDKVLKKQLDWDSLGLKYEETNIKTPPTDHSHLHEESKEEEAAGETWQPTKMLKTSPTNGEDDEVSHQTPPKKTRVCVRARCDTPTMNDGCQWRKYGQKIAKGNPCPRAYYRCTGAPSCPVRKQVQRSVEDISILITTYEGTHNHPLPVSAMAMASTTSAAASMLVSGSSTSTSRPGPSIATVNSSANLHGMNLYLSNNSNSKQFYMQNSSILSSSLSHPTITLDLTSNPPSTSTSTSTSSPFHKNIYPPKYPFTNLDFGSNNNNSQSNLMSWSNGGYNANQAYNKNTIGTALDLAARSVQMNQHSNIYQTYLQKMNNQSSIPPPSDPIAAATKAITSDPSFQSALAAALSSIIGGSSGSTGGEILTPQGNGCGSSLLSKTVSNSTNSHQGSMAFLPPTTTTTTTTTLTRSNSKSPSSSPGNSRDHTK